MELLKQYEWLRKEPGPQMLIQALALLGTNEYKGAADNPRILAWADECGIRNYTHDSIPWCGLAMAIVAKRAGWDYRPKNNALYALNWASWGVGQKIAMLGDVLVFTRKGGGHVTQYVGEDKTHYHCIGGNQLDQFNIVRRPKLPIEAIQRAPWRIAEPANVRVVHLASTGLISTKES